jgi:hypothetical protein
MCSNIANHSDPPWHRWDSGFHSDGDYRWGLVASCVKDESLRAFPEITVAPIFAA